MKKDKPIKKMDDTSCGSGKKKPKRKPSINPNKK
jgi:hypothetical protein